MESMSQPMHLSTTRAVVVFPWNSTVIVFPQNGFMPPSPSLDSGPMRRYESATMFSTVPSLVQPQAPSPVV